MPLAHDGPSGLRVLPGDGIEQSEAGDGLARFGWAFENPLGGPRRVEITLDFKVRAAKGELRYAVISVPTFLIRLELCGFGRVVRRLGQQCAQRFLLQIPLQHHLASPVRL